MKNLKRLDKKRHDTGSLAEILGVDKSSISKWETTDIIPDQPN